MTQLQIPGPIHTLPARVLQCVLQFASEAVTASPHQLAAGPRSLLGAPLPNFSGQAGMEEAPRIVGGNPASQADYPYMAVVRGTRNDSTGITCVVR